MAKKEEFSIETKLKIAGVEATGNLDGGTLKFNVDTSAFKKLVTDATKTAAQVKKKLDSIKLNKIKIELNQNSLRTVESQIRKAITNAVKKVQVDVGANVTTGKGKAGSAKTGKVEKHLDAFANYIKEANKSARSFAKTMERLVEVAKSMPKGAIAGGTASVKAGDGGSVPMPGGGGGDGPPMPKGAGAGQSVDLNDQAAVNAEQARIALEETQRKAQETKDALKNAFNIPGLTQKLQGQLKNFRENIARVQSQATDPKKAVKARGKIQDTIGTFNQLREAQGKAPLEDSKAIEQLRKMSNAESQREATFRKKVAAMDAKAAQAAERLAASRRKSVQAAQKELAALMQRQKAMGGAGGGGGRFGGGGGGMSSGGGPDPDKQAEGFNKLEQGIKQSTEQLVKYRFAGAVFNEFAQAIRSATAFVVDFNDQVLELNKILQQQGAVLGQTKAQLIELSTATGVSSVEVAQIAEAFARAGLEGRNFGSVVDLTEKALLGFQGTTLSAEQASTLMIQVIGQMSDATNQLKPELITTTKLFDILGRAEDITASKASDVATALRRSAASLFATGADIEQVTGIISVLQETTQRGGEVIGTALKTVASRISNSSSDAAKALQNIGVQTVNADGSLRNIIDVLAQVKTNFKQLSEAEQANTLVAVAGVRQVEILRSALNSFGRIQEVITEARNADGDATRKQLVEQQKFSNLLGKITAQFNKFVDAASGSDSGIAAGLKTLLSGFEGLLSVINKVDAFMGNFLSKTAGLAALVVGVKFAYKGFQAMKLVIAEIQGFIGKSQERVIKLGAETDKTSSVASNKLNTAFQGTSAILTTMNEQMARFAQQTERAALRAEQLAVARKQAMAELGPGASESQIGARSGEIINAADRRSVRETLDARSRAHQAVNDRMDGRIYQRSGSQLMGRGRVIGTIPGSMTKLQKATKTVTGAFNKLGGAIAGNAGILALLGGGSLVEATSGGDQPTASSMAGGIAGRGAQGAGAGLMVGGPVGAIIGALGGSLYGVYEQFKLIDGIAAESVTNLSELARYYGLASTNAANYTQELSKQLQGELKNLEAIKAGKKQETAEAKGLVALNQEKTPEVANLLGQATKILKEAGGTLGANDFDLAQPTLADIGSPQAATMSQQQVREVADAVKKMTENQGLSEEQLSQVANKIDQWVQRSELARMGIDRQKKDTAVGQALNVLTVAIPDLVLAMKEQNAADTLAARQRQTAGRQRRGVENVGASMINPLISATQALGYEGNRFGANLQNFANQVSNSIMQLNKSLLMANTPQQELAKATAALAQQDLKNVIKLSATDNKVLVEKFRTSIADITSSPEFQAQGATEDVKGLQKTIVSSLLGAVAEIQAEGVTDIGDVQGKIREAAKNIPTIGLRLLQDTQDKIFDATTELSTKILSNDNKIAKARTAVNKALVAALNQTLQEENRQIQLSKSRRDIARINAQSQIQLLTGSRALVAQRKLEVSFTNQNIAALEEQVNSLDARIMAEKDAIKQDQNNVAAKDKLFILEQKRTDVSIQLETQLANARLASASATKNLSAAVLQQVQDFSSFQKSFVDGVNGIVDVLAVGRTPIEEFNAKLSANSQSFRISQAELAAEAEVVNSTISDQAERTAALASIQRRSVQATMEAAKAEADIIAQRREAVKQITGDLLKNQDAQAQAQGQIIEATKGVSAAFQAYRDAANGSILATTKYNINLKLTETANQKLLGSLNGTKQEIDAVSSIFRQAESTARQMGSSERTLLEIRRDSINQQLQLFNDLLSEQSSLARQFFQGSAQDQADLFLGLQEAGGVAELLGGSFDSFKKMGETAINDLGSQLLALPQESRQRIIQSLETLKTVGGSVGGFGAQELLTAIETASLGVSGEGLNVDPLFEVQQRIADLSEQQARLATDDLINAQEGVRVAKEALENAKAQRDMAEIQLERIREEGTQLRSKLGNLQGELKSSILRGTEVQKNGFNNVAGAINRMSNQVLTRLPESFSMAVAQEFRNNMSAAGLAGAMPTQMSPGAQQAQALRQAGNNVAQNIQGQRAAASQLSTISTTADSAQRDQNNLPGGAGTEQTNKILDTIKQDIKDLLTAQTEANTALTAIDTNTATGGTSGGTTAAAQLTPLPDINVNIAGQQQIQVTGFEAGVQQIVAGLVETFGGFVTDTEATNIANQVVESIRLQLERLGILNRNQL